MGAAAILAAHPQQASPGPGSSSTAPIPVKGTERIAWDQASPPGGWIVAYQFSAFVDGVRQALPGASCSPVFCTQCTCSAPLPRMSDGTHSLSIAARDVFGQESAPSVPISLAVSSTSGASAAARPFALVGRTVSDAMPPAGHEILSASLDRPSALAVSEDGRIFVADRSGITVWKDKQAQSAPTRFEDQADGDGVQAVDLTLHPDFLRNSQLFVAYTARRPDGQYTNRIVRYREIGGVLGEAAAIFEDPVDRLPVRTPRIRFGPDRKLYALFPTHTAGLARDGASYQGKILRLDADGRTPVDNPGMTPVFAEPSGTALAFDWQPATGALWIAASDGGVMSLETISRGGHTPFSSKAIGGPDAVAIAFEGPRNSTLSDRLLVVPFEGEQATRISLDRAASRPNPLARQSFGALWGRVTDLIVTPDGTVYYCAIDPATTGRDRLIRTPSTVR